MRKRVSQSFTSSKSGSMSFNGNMKADNSHFDAPAEVEIKKGMLTMDKQVVFATLSNIKLLLASPKGEVVSENTMFGKKIKVRVGVLACWRVGVLAYWRIGVLACWRVGVMA
jgi:autotransporter translocation and assembly factor TamB